MEKFFVNGDPLIPSIANVVVWIMLLDSHCFVGLYTATGGAELVPPPLGGPCAPPRTLRHAHTALELDFNCVTSPR
jgi:hypothetical protein